jgi:hypothetical protein
MKAWFQRVARVADDDAGIGAGGEQRLAGAVRERRGEIVAGSSLLGQDVAGQRAIGMRGAAHGGAAGSHIV